MILGDSYIYSFLLPLLSESFEDVYFIRYSDAMSAARDIMENAAPDLVVFEMVERQFDGAFTRFGEFGTYPVPQDNQLLNLPELQEAPTLHIDMPQVSENGIVIDENTDITSIAGWAADVVAGQPAMYVYMLAGDRVYRAKKYERPDLTTMNPDYLQAGFRFDIPIAELKGIRKVVFYALNHDGTKRYLPVEIALSFRAQRTEKTGG
jgi:hypothetical protein